MYTAVARVLARCRALANVDVDDRENGGGQ
jgi:hypothetical protein